MHKKLAAELVSLANSILALENNDVNTLHQKSKELYEKLTVLKFVEQNLAKIDHNEEENKVVPKVETVDEVIEGVNEFDDETISQLEEVIETPTNEKLEPEKVEETAFVKLIDETVEQPEEMVEEKIIEDAKSNEIELEFEQPTFERKDDIETFFSLEENELKNDPKDILQYTLKSEFEDAISADEATELFEKATRENPVIEEKPVSPKRSLNDALFKGNIQVGLNDRIAFVKHLFDGSQEDFNRVLSQLNSFETEKEAKSFINKMVKPDYNWNEKEEYEQRLLNLIERKFM